MADADLTYGGRVQFMNVSNRSISLKETFEKPLVIGYHAFDVPILYDGTLGLRRVDTYTRLAITANTIAKSNAVKEWLLMQPYADEQLEDWRAVNEPWLRANGFTHFVAEVKETKKMCMETRNELNARRTNSARNSKSLGSSDSSLDRRIGGYCLGSGSTWPIE